MKYKTYPELYRIGCVYWLTWARFVVECKSGKTMVWVNTELKGYMLRQTDVSSGRNCVYENMAMFGSSDTVRLLFRGQWVNR